MQKPILDPCCGSRMFYFNKQNPLVDYRDNRDFQTKLCDGRTLEVHPERIDDVLQLTAPDNTYYLVVFDPPHLSVGNDTGWQIQKYGKLPKDWETWMTQAFKECWRVLKPNGTLIFKWYEYKITLSEILKCIPVSPILGNKKPHQSKTHWLVFFKTEDNI